jgi:hypothetical protein
MNRHSRIIGYFFFAFLFLLPKNAYTITTDLKISVDETSARVSATLSGSDSEQITHAIIEGLKSEIIFQFRLYKKNTGFFSFTGDIFISEKSTVRIAYKDFFRNYFIIQSGNATEEFTDESEFFTEFFSIDGFGIEFPKNMTSGEYFIRCRITLNPVKVEPPLHIVSLITPIGTSTPWVEQHFIRMPR